MIITDDVTSNDTTKDLVRWDSDRCYTFHSCRSQTIHLITCQFIRYGLWEGCILLPSFFFNEKTQGKKPTTKNDYNKENKTIARRTNNNSYAQPSFKIICSTKLGHTPFQTCVTPEWWVVSLHFIFWEQANLAKRQNWSKEIAAGHMRYSKSCVT